MQTLQKQTEVSLASQEQTQLAAHFAEFIGKVRNPGASYTELQALLTILQAVTQHDRDETLTESLATHIQHLLTTIIPDPLTLAEAASIFGVNADTLRRACWQGRLNSEKRGKTWFVKVAELERFLNSKSI